MPVHGSGLWKRAEDDRRVVPTKSKTVAHRRAGLPLAGFVGHVVEIALWIGVLIVDGGPDPARLERLDAGQALERARRAEHMTGHALGRRDDQVPRVLAKDVID